MINPGQRIGPGTVKYHVNNILSKLNVTAVPRPHRSGASAACCMLSERRGDPPAWRETPV
jgi:DNA-binding NarL/FixJ family response regulator